MSYGLRTALNAQVPGDLVAVSRMDVLLGPDRRARPDVSLVDDLAASDDGRTCYLAEEVRLVIEVVSPDSAASDRDLRPRHYAAAGIPHFWRVESTDFRPFVYSFELDADGAGYQVTGVHHTRLTVDSPSPSPSTSIGCRADYVRVGRAASVPDTSWRAHAPSPASRGTVQPPDSSWSRPNASGPIAASR
ncbi:hypothetical protein GCM10027612_76450 [Microbispora bryophytorum subsp. camponoti]